MIKEKTLSVNGLNIAYTDTGPEDGRILFCVHGLLSNGRDYDALATHLAQHGYRVISIDLPGRGKSDWFPNPALYALPHYIPCCLALLTHVANGKPFDWLGVSLGGLIGMALHNFEGLKMERLILVDVGAELPGFALDDVATLAKSPTLYQTREDAVSFLKKRCGAWGITKQETWDHLIAHNIVQNSDGTTRLHYDPAIGVALADKNETILLWDLWQSIRQPVLLLRGGTSSLLPASVSEQMKERYQGTCFTEFVFPNCGHVPNLMEEEHLQQISKWLLAEQRA